MTLAKNTQHESKDEPIPTEFEIYNDQIDIKSLPIFTRSRLALFNGIDKPQVYVAIRGYIYDVSNNLKSYGPGKSYHKLVGKDVTRLLGLNRLQLKPTTENTTGDPSPKENTWYSDNFTDKQNQVVDKWVLFFRKRYKIVGIVVDHEVDSLI